MPSNVITYSVKNMDKWSFRRWRLWVQGLAAVHEHSAVHQCDTRVLLISYMSAGTHLHVICAGFGADGGDAGVPAAAVWRAAS